MVKDDDEDIGKKGLINATFGVASSIIATLLIGLYVQIGSSSQELVRLQEQMKSLQQNLQQYNGLGSDVKALQVQTSLLADRVEKIEERQKEKY